MMEILFTFFKFFLISLLSNVILFIFTLLSRVQFVTRCIEPTTFLVLLYAASVISSTEGKYEQNKIGIIGSGFILSWVAISITKRLFEGYKSGYLNKFSSLEVAKAQWIKFLINAITSLSYITPNIIVLVNRGGPTHFGILGNLGFIIWAYGIIVYLIAVIQKAVFKKNNPGEFTHTGVWKIYRYPDLSAQIFIWIGNYIFCLTSLTREDAILLLFLSPVLRIITIVVLDDGIIKRDKIAEEKYGHRKDWIEYRNNTPSVLLNVRKMTTKLFKNPTNSQVSKI